jgi:Ca2+-binding RTX toxin-like protein
MIRLNRRAAVTAALASIAALSAPAAANATVTPVVNNTTLTVTSDDVGDTITLSVVNGHLAVGAAETTLNADNNADIVVNAGGGNDIVDASALAAANYKTLTVSGGEGNDTLTGGIDVDALNGDGGNDRVVGFKGNDRDADNGGLFGGGGDDVLVWNNGDGTDTADGGDGFDEVEVNGNPTGNDVTTAKPSVILPGWVRFDRTSEPGSFGIDLRAERLTVSTLGGNDTFAPDPLAPTGLGALTSLTLNGGTGDDSLTGVDGGDKINGGGGGDALNGGDGADLVTGGDDSDELAGDGGDDRLVGDRGVDLAAGGAGDDTLVWNNGDASDINSGDAGFDRVEINGSATGGDVFTLAPNLNPAFDPQVELKRTNLVPFQVSIASPSTEAIAINGGGGNDQLTVSPGLTPPMLVAADGGAGNDTLTGAEETDSFFGGSGNDAITGGGGSDLLDGDEGDDSLFSRDRTGDLVRGGVGTDSAQTDAVTVDAYSGIEALDATPLPAPIVPDPGDTRALLPRLGKAKVVRSGRKLVARIPISCPAAEAGGCRTTLTLETARAVKLGKVRAPVVLGSKSVRLRGGQRSTVSVRLTGGAASLAKRGKLATRARITTSDAAGNTAVKSVALGLRTPRR